MLGNLEAHPKVVFIFKKGIQSHNLFVGLLIIESNFINEFIE